MLPKDIESVVCVHNESFPGFFLTLLGPGFLRLTYRSILQDATAIAIVAERDNAILGFACGTSAPRSFYRRLFQKQWWRFGYAALRSLAMRPSMIRHFAGALRTRIVSTEKPWVVELMSLGISPKVQRQGIGGNLVLRFLDEARRRGAVRATLTTDRYGNQSANSFYARHGFVLMRSFATNTGRELNRYEIGLRDLSPIDESPCS